jgi:hypothetical protein
VTNKDQNRLSDQDIAIITSAIMTTAKEAGWKQTTHKGYGAEVDIYNRKYGRNRYWYGGKDDRKMVLELEKQPFKAEVEVDYNGMAPAATVVVTYTADLSDPESLKKLQRILKLTKRG